MSKKLLHKIAPVIAVFTITLITFYKIFTSGLYPFPGNFLVSQYFPWYNGGWDGYDSWTTTKGTLASDAVRQSLSWHRLTFEYIKQNFSIPLWNPYNYSGTPHLANIQTFIFNPFNLLFVILPLSKAWIVFVILQIPLALIFTYLFSRSLGLGKSSSLFSGVAFVFSSYFIIWFEIGIVGYSILWLPLMLYSIQNLLSNFKLRYLFLLIFSSSSCIFSGHIQTAIFIFLIALSYWIFKLFSLKKDVRSKALILALIWLISTLLITAMQTIPSIELYLNSPLNKAFSREVFNKETMPFKNILALFSPDFFGSPATNNLWTTQYGDGTPNIGVFPLFFAIFALFSLRKKEIRYFLVLSLAFLLFATKSPLYHLIKYLKVPILTGTSPVRDMFAFCFGMSMLAAFGLENYAKAKNINKRTYSLLGIFTIIYGIFILFTFLLPLFLKNSNNLLTNLLVTRRNLVIPFLCILLFSSTFIAKTIFKKTKFYKLRLDIFIIIIVTVAVGIYQLNKTSNFSKMQNFFPNHPLVTWLQDNGSINRFYGEGTARFENNFATYYHVYSAEGYSVFRLSKYAELIASQDSGNVQNKYNRADADFSGINIPNRTRLFDLLGVKYLIAKDDFERDARFIDPDKPEADANLSWQSGKFKIYQRDTALPRFFLSSNFIVAKSDQEILDKIYDDNFDLHTIILEKSPNIASALTPNGQVELLDYRQDNILFKTKSENDTLLFLSDSYYPGWEARIDNIKTEIYRADYAFRAIDIPKGDHTISFNFRPKTVYYGLYISLTGFISVVIYFIFALKKKLF